MTDLVKAFQHFFPARAVNAPGLATSIRVSDNVNDFNEDEDFPRRAPVFNYDKILQILRILPDRIDP